ncbi:MAG: hypothetical protein HOQ36_11330 [Nocardia sp.]|nr:hypothetical protein [Nocardia sp.]
MRKICAAFALAAGVAAAAPGAHADPQRLDANVGVFKVVHIDHSVIVAYDCPSGATAAITVDLTNATTGRVGKGAVTDVTCAGGPAIRSVATDLGAGEHGDRVVVTVGIKARNSAGASVEKTSTYQGVSDSFSIE